MYFFIEAAIALFVSFLINIFVVSVFAEGLYGKTNADIHELCIAANNSHADQFPINNQTVEADLYKGGVFLGCTYGALAMYAIGTTLSTVCNLNQISGMSGLLGC